jgi:carbonic anhydrase
LLPVLNNRTYKPAIMKSYEKLLANNKVWANDQVEKDPDFFNRLANIQKPEFLWIGCSDSRVPANEITGTNPGEIFVHRNVANMVVHTDVNLASVLDYALNALNVKHVIVTGHYGCGGVKACMGNTDYGPILNKWLRNIKDVYRQHQAEVDAEPDEQSRFDKLVEMNVYEQVMNLAKTSIIQKCWKEKRLPELHGWVYSLSDGLIKPVVHLTAEYEVDPLYRYDLG